VGVKTNSHTPDNGLTDTHSPRVNSLSLYAIFSLVTLKLTTRYTTADIVAEIGPWLTGSVKTRGVMEGWGLETPQRFIAISSPVNHTFETVI